MNSCFDPSSAYARVLPGQGRLCRPERLEPEHGTSYPFDESMILLHNIVQVFTLTDLYAFAFIEIVLFDGGRIGSAFVDIDQAGFAVRPDGFVQESAGSLRITLSR